MIAFPEAINIPIPNHLTGARYCLMPAARLSSDAATLARIASICNEPDVYRWLFREPLGGRPYPEQMAREWIEWSKAGWRSQSHFVFVVLDETNTVAAACDIKSAAPNAEIGYWSSQEHRGVMTNAIVAMSDLAAKAGFLGLFARTKQGNARSEAVLVRAGFERSRDGSGDHACFVRMLKSKHPPIDCI